MAPDSQAKSAAPSPTPKDESGGWEVTDRTNEKASSQFDQHEKYLQVSDLIIHTIQKASEDSGDSSDAELYDKSLQE